MYSILAYRLCCPGFDSQDSPKKFIGKIVDVVEINQWRCFGESGQWLENVDHTHLVLVSDKLVLQKSLVGTTTLIEPTSN